MHDNIANIDDSSRLSRRLCALAEAPLVCFILHASSLQNTVPLLLMHLLHALLYVQLPYSTRFETSFNLLAHIVSLYYYSFALCFLSSHAGSHYILI